MARSASKIYGHRHESLLHMWKVARSIAAELALLEEQLKGSLGITLDSDIQYGALGIQQMIFNTSGFTYYTIL